MIKTLSLLAALLLLVMPGTLVAADDDNEEGTQIEGELTAGGHIGDFEDYEGKVGEYEQVSTDGRPDATLKLKTEGNGIFWDLFAKHYDTKDQEYLTTLDLRRILKAYYGFDRLPHWLDNDPISNINSKMGGKQNTSENLEVDADYVIAYGEHKGGLEFTPPAVPNLSFNVGYRDQHRDGRRQSRSVSHCANCHAVAQGRDIDESTRDITAGTSFKSKLVQVDYTFLNRKFEENSTTPSSRYYDAMHPVRGSVWTDPETGDTINYGVIFNARLQFEDATLPVDMVPDMDKNTHKVRARVDIHGNASASASFVSSSIENQYTGNQIDSQSFYGLFTKRWGTRNKVRFNARFRHQSLDNDDVNVDVLNSEAYEG